VKRPAVWLALALLLFTTALLTYRIVWLGYPVFPTAPGRTWQLLIDAHIKGGGEETTLAFALPTEQVGRMLVEEKVTSGALRFNLLREGPNRIGVWSGPIGSGEEEINYRAIILIRPGRSLRVGPPTLENPPPIVAKEEQVLAERLTKNWRYLSPTARIKAVAAATAGEWGEPFPEDQDIQAWKVVQGKHGRVIAFLTLLEASGLPARAVEGFRLFEGVKTRPLTWIEVWTGQRWESLKPETGEVEKNPAILLPLATGRLPAVRVSGGELSEIRWILNREAVSRWRLHFERILRSKRFLDQWSLFRLPPEFQQTFRILLLVPIGALMIGVLRNLVGFPTFGIFMPVLMALAFRGTGLGIGLGIFAGVLLIGYAVRRLLDKLRLLLVPRMSVMVTLVIACFTGLALVGNKYGLRAFMAVGLLPFVILTMTIERFFVIVEEAGIREGMRTAAGSAAVSVITYGIISWEPLQLTFFVYPELLGGVAAVQILLGRYAGYRLSEIFRFRTFRGAQ
jgi:hypothetical protein